MGGEKEKRKKISKEIIFNSGTINVPLSEWSSPFQCLEFAREALWLLEAVPTDHGLSGKHSMPVTAFY